MDDRMWFLKPFIEAAKTAEAIDLAGNKSNETLKSARVATELLATL